MGYTTEFTGAIALNRKLTLKEAKELLEVADLDRDDAAKITGTNAYMQWVPATTLEHIVWDGNEKFYDWGVLMEWVCGWLKERGIQANGMLNWRGESSDDNGQLVVADNVVMLMPSKQTARKTPEPLTLDGLRQIALEQLVQ